MALYGHAIKSASIATAGSISSAILIQGFSKVGIEVPASALVTTTCNIKIQVAQTEDGTFRDFAMMGVYSGGSGVFPYEVPSNTQDMFLDADFLAGWNYIKIKPSTATTKLMNNVVHLSNLKSI